MNELRLPLSTSRLQLEDAVVQVQGRARTNMLDRPLVVALVGLALDAWSKVLRAAEALDTPASDLEPRGVWCATTKYGDDGVHTVLELSPVGWRVYRGAVGGGRRLGTVSLTIPAPRRST